MKEEQRNWLVIYSPRTMFETDVLSSTLIFFFNLPFACSFVCFKRDWTFKTLPLWPRLLGILQSFRYHRTCSLPWWRPAGCSIPYDSFLPRVCLRYCSCHTVWSYLFTVLTLSRVWTLDGDIHLCPQHLAHKHWISFFKEVPFSPLFFLFFLK